METDDVSCGVLVVARWSERRPSDNEESSTVEVLACRGEIDLVSAPVLVDALARVTTKHCIVDLSGVTFMGAAGVNALVEAATRCGSVGGTLTLRRPPPLIARLLDVLEVPSGIVVSNGSTP
jgi:anti-anti-sigma factor